MLVKMTQHAATCSTASTPVNVRPKHEGSLRSIADRFGRGRRRAIRPDLSVLVKQSDMYRAPNTAGGTGNEDFHRLCGSHLSPF